MRYWLMKSEPSVYALADLAREGQTNWEGVRNYQARNLMRDGMTVGDRVLFYHSSTEPPGIAGTAIVCETLLPDPTQWEPASPYYDPKSKRENPTWIMVRLAYEATFTHFIPLGELRSHPELHGMMVLQKGSRLSVQPVDAAHFAYILQLGTG